MNKYVKYLVLVVVIVIGFLGIKTLYDRLADEYKPDSNLVVENTQSGQIEDGVDIGIEETTQSSANTSTEETIGTTDTQQTEATTQPGTETSKAIDFNVEDVDGNVISLYSKVGKPIVVNFWASWCSPCKAELPDFQLAYEKFGEDIEFMMVNLTDGRSETVEGASEFVNTEGYMFPVYYDVNQEAAMAYYVMSIPTTYFIDADGNVVAYAQGMIDYDTLLQGIDMIR